MGNCACNISQMNSQIVLEANNSNINYSNRSLPSSLPHDYSLSFQYKHINYSDQITSNQIIPSYYDVSQLAEQHTFQEDNTGTILVKQNKSYINVVIIGGKGVGKSCFLIKSVYNKFEKLYIPTIGIENIRRAVRLEGMRYALNFIVTPGDEKYRADYSVIFKDVNVLLLFYDVSDMGSFKEGEDLFRKVEQVYKEMIEERMPVVFLVGTKADKPNVVGSDVIKEFCKKYKIRSSIEISTKNGVGIKGLINSMIKATINRKENV